MTQFVKGLMRLSGVGYIAQALLQTKRFIKLNSDWPKLLLESHALVYKR